MSTTGTVVSVRADRMGKLIFFVKPDIHIHGVQDLFAHSSDSKSLMPFEGQRVRFELADAIRQGMKAGVKAINVQPE